MNDFKKKIVFLWNKLNSILSLKSSFFKKKENKLLGPLLIITSLIKFSNHFTGWLREF